MKYYNVYGAIECKEICFNDYGAECFDYIVKATSKEEALKIAKQEFYNSGDYILEIDANEISEEVYKQSISIEELPFV